jgi:diacylglycerol kinase family enzyme
VRTAAEAAGAEQVPGVTVIVNARARNAGGNRFVELEGAFARVGLPVRLDRVTDGAAIATRAREAAARGEQVVAAGGDGTVGTVAAVAVEAGATFGVIPLGTLNHFARDAGIPTDLDAAVAAIAAGHVRTLDVGEVNGRVFVNNSSLGLYPRLVWEREAEQRRGRGKWTAFAIALFRTWRRYRTVTVRLTVDGREHVRRTPFVFIGNNAYRLEGLQMAARTALDHGQLSLYVAPHCGRFEILALPFRALAGRLAADVTFESFSATALSIETARRHVSVALDGEVAIMRPPLHYRIRAAALRTIVPSRA